VTHGLLFRNSSRTRPGVQILYLSLCSDQGTNITVHQQRLEMRLPIEDPFEAWGVSLGIYETRDGSGWERAARDLVKEIESLWPGEVLFRGDRGQVIPMPKELQPGDASAPMPSSGDLRSKGGQD